MKTKLAAVLMLLFSVSLAYADYFDGNDLIKLMNTAEAQSSGYVAGVQDSFNGVYFCVPPEVRLSQAMKVVSQYIKARPKGWHEPARTHVIEALQEAFPCKQ